MDIKKLLEFIGMDEKQVDMNHFVETSNGYEILTKSGEYRTYSDSSFENNFKLSRIRKNNTESFFRDVKYLNEQGEETSLRVADHRHKGKNLGYSTDIEGKHIIPKQNIDILENPEMSEIEYMKSMEEDILSRIAYRNRRSKAGTLKGHTGKERVSIVAGAEVDKIIQQIYDIGEVSPELAKRGFELIKQRKKNSQVAEKSMNRVYYDIEKEVREEKKYNKNALQTVLDRIGMAEKDYRELQKNVRDAAKSTAINDNAKRDTAKIFKAINKDATMENMQKKIQKKASNLSKMANNAFLEIQDLGHTITNKKAEALEAIKGTPMHGYSTKGLWRMGAESKIAPIKSAQKTVTKDFARDIRSSFAEPEKNNSIYTNTAQHHNVGKNNYYNSSIDKAKEVLKNGKGLFFDYETTGQRGTKSFAPLQFSARWTDKQGVSYEQEYLIQMTKDQISYIDNLISRIQDPEYNPSKLSEDERRDLLSMTNYTMGQDGKVKAKHIEYAKNVDLANKELQAKIKEGRDLMAAENKNAEQIGLVASNKWGETLRGFARTHADKIWAGHNINTFDTPINEASEANIKNTFDMLDFVKQHFEIGHKNAKGEMLLAHNLGALGKHFGVDMDAIGKDITQHTGTYDTAFTKAVLEKAIQEAKNVSKPIKSQTITANRSFGFVKKGYFRGDGDEFSFKTNAIGDLIDQNAWGDMLLKKGSGYIFGGTIQKEVNGMMKRFSKYTNIETGDESYIYLNDGQTADTILSNQFEDGFYDVGKDMEILGEIANKTAILSMFDSSSGWYNLKAMNGGYNTSEGQKNRQAKLTPQAKEVLNFISEQIGAKAANLPSEAKSLMLGEIGDKIGIQHYKRYNSGDFHRDLLGDMSNLSLGNTKSILKSFVETNKKSFKKGFVKDFNRTINNLDLTEDSFKHRDGQSAIYGLTRLMYNNLNDNFFADKNSASSIGNFENLKADSKELSNVVDSVISDYNMRYGANPVDTLYNDAPKILQDLLSGQDTKERLKKTGWNMSEEFSDLYDGLGKKDGKFGRNSVGETLKRVSDFLANPENGGIHSVLRANPNGRGFRFGVFAPGKAHEVKDRDGNLLFDKMAGYVDVEMGENGSIKINGMEKANHLLPMYSKESGTSVATLREGYFKAMLEGMTSDENRKRILSGEAGSIMSSLRWYGEQFLERSAGSTYKSTEAEGIDSVSAGGPVEKMFSKSNMMDLEKYLFDAALGAGYTREDIGYGYDRENMFSALMDYYTNVSLGTESILENTNGFYLNTKEGLKNGRYEKRDAFKEIIRKVATANRVDMAATRQGAYLTGRLAYGGAHKLMPFAVLSSEQSRYHDQFYNYVPRMRSQKKRNAAYKKGLTLKSHLSTPTGVSEFGNNYYSSDILDKFALGTTTDAAIASVYSNLDSLLQQDIAQGIITQKEAEQISKEFKNNPYASVAEGSAIMSESMYNEISNNLYETVTKEINAKDIDTLKGQFGKTIKTLNYGDSYNVEDGKLKRALKLSKIDLDEGDILHAIERTDDGRYQAVFGKKYQVGKSSKGVTSGGDRNTVGTIMKDVAAKFLFRHTGNEGASMISDYSPNVTKLGNFIGGRVEFMIDKYWAEAEKSGMKTNDIIKNIQSALDKTSILGKTLKYDKDSNTFSQNMIYTNDGFQYYDNNGKLVSLLNNSDDINAFFDEDYGYDKDNTSGRKGDLEILGRELFKDESLFGENYYEKTKNLVAQSYAISNLYGTKEAIGSGLSEKELALSSKFKLGLKEKNAIKTTLNSAKIANKDLSFSGLEKYFKSYFGGKDPNAVAKELAFNRAWKDTALLSKTREDKDALLQNRLTSENGAVDLSNIVEIVTGKATQRNQISIADLYTSDEANYTGVMSEKDFEKTSAGRLLSFVKGLGISPENARIIARTGEDIEIHNNWGRKATKYRDKFNPVLSDIAIALTPALKNKDGEVLYGDDYKNLNALFKNIYDMSNPDADQRYKAENLRKASQGYLNTLFSPQDKDSALFDELTKAPLESSMRGHTVGANIALGEKFDNVMMVNDQDLSKMLGSEADVNSDKFRKHISDLLTYYDKSFGTKYSKNITDFDALDKKGRKQFEKGIIKDIINKVDINNQSGDGIKSLFGLGHRYPSTYDETVMFQRLMVDKSLDRGTMRFGSGLATQMNADFDGDHTETALTLLNNLSAYSEEEQTQLFNEMRRITEQKDAERRLLGDWTRRKAGMVWDDATSQWIDPTSIEDKAMSRSKKMQKFGAMRANPQNEAISGWLSKRNFGNIGQFSTLSTKFRDATRKFEKDPSKNIMTGMARAMYEITEQDSISAKKVGERLMLKNQGADFNATMENIIHGIELFRSQLMTYSGDTKSFVDNIAKTGSEIGFFGEKGSDNFIESRQMAAVVARMQTLIDSEGTSDEDRAKLKTAMERYGATAITTGANRGEGGYISYEGFVNLMTDVVDSFGGVRQMQEAINAANGSTRGSNENKIGKYFEREIENIEKGKNINAPFIGNVKTTTDETSTGSGTPSSNNLPEFSVGTLTVGTINTGSIVSGTGIGSGTTSVSGSGLGKGAGGGYVNSLVSGAEEYSNYIQYPDSPLDIHNPISVDKHARFARNILREKGLNPYTAQDVKEASMKSLRLVTKDGKHDYFLGTEKIVPDATGSQLGSIMDVTAYSKIDSQAEKLKTHIEELYSGNTKFTINNVESTYDNIEDLVLSMSDIGDTRKMYQLSKAIGSAKKGDLVHKIEEALINNSISRDDLTLDGVRKNKDLAEDVKSYEEGMRRIGQRGYNSNSLLQGIIENASAMYDIKANILGKGNLEKYSEQVAEKSFLLSFGKEGTPNQFRIAGTVDNLINNLGALDWKNENAIKSNEHIMQLAFAQKGFRSIFGDANGDAILNSIIGSFTGNKNFKIAEYKLDNLTDQQWADFLNMARAKQALGTSSVNQPVIGEFSYGGNETFLTQKGIKAANDFYKMMYQLESGDSIELAKYAKDNNLFSVKEDLIDAENKKMTFARYDEKTGRLFSVEALKGTSGSYEISTPKEEYVGDQYLEFSKKYHKLEAERRTLEEEMSNAEESQKEAIRTKQLLNFNEMNELMRRTPDYFKQAVQESPMLKMADIYSKTYTSPTTGNVVDGSALFKEFDNLNNQLSNVSLWAKKYNEVRQTGTYDQQESVFSIYSGARNSRDEAISRINGLLEGDAFDDDTKATIRSYLDEQINAGYLEERGARNNSTLQETQTAMKEYLSIQNENNRLMIDRNGYLEQANKSFRKSDKDFYMGKVAEVDRTIEANNFRMQYHNGALISSTNPNKPIVLSEDERMAFESRISANRQQNEMKLQRQQIAQQNTGLFGKIKGGIRNAVDYMVGYSLGYSIIGMVKQSVTMTIQQVMQLNKTMTDLAIVTGKNVSEMRELVGEYNNLAKQIGLTNAEVNASANEWLRMGYKESEINTLIKNTAMLSKLGMIEMGEATQYMTSAIKGYGVAVQDSMQIVDMATSLDMKYAVSAGYILEAMSRTATSAKLAKVEMSDLQAMIAVIGETSQKDASVVGESLKTAFARYGNVKAGAFLGNSDLTSLEEQYEYETFSQENADSLDDAAVNDIEKVLDKMDIDIRNGSEWRSYSDILEEVGKNFKNLSDYEKNAITTAMFGTRQRENGLIVLENYNKVLEAEKIAAEAAGSSIIKYEKYLESVEAAKAKVTTAYEGLILDIKGAEFIKDVLNKIAFALEHIGAILGTIGASTLLLNLPKVLLGFSRLSTLPMFMGGLFNKRKLSYDKMTSTYEQGYENLVYTGRIGKFDDSMSKYFSRHGYNSDEIKNNIPWKDKATGNFRPVDEDRTFSSWIDNKVDKNPILSKIKNKTTNNISNESIISSRNGLTPADRYLNNYRKTMTQADYADAVGIKLKDLAKVRAGGGEASQAQIDKELRNLNKMSNTDLFKAYTESGLFNTDTYFTEMAKMSVNDRISAITDKAMTRFDTVDWRKIADDIISKNGGSYTRGKGDSATTYTDNAEDINRLANDLEAKARRNARNLNSNAVVQSKLEAEELDNLKGKSVYDIERERLKTRHKRMTGKTIDDATAERLMKREATVASGIDAASSMLGLMVGAQAGSAMGQAFAEFIGGDEETWGMVGSAIGMGLLPYLMNTVSTSATKLWGPIKGSLAGAGIGLAVAGITAAVNSYKKAVEKAEKAQAEKVEKSQEKIEKYSSLDTQTKFERYDKLAKGVNQYGDNISLTDTEYEEFQTLGDELGNQFDNLIIGTDRFGHSLLGTEKGLGGLADASEELLKIEKQKLYKEKLEEPEAGDSLFKKAFDKYNEKKEALESKYDIKWINSLNEERTKNRGYKFEATRLNDSDGGVKNSKHGSFLNENYSNKMEDEIKDILKPYVEKNGEDIQYLYYNDLGKAPEIQIDTNGGELSTDEVNEVCTEIAEVINKYSSKMVEEYEKELQAAQLEFTKEFLPAILNTNPIWEQLDDSTQSFVNQVASGIDLAANNIKSADDYKTLIEDKVLSPINKLTEEELLKFEQRVAAFADKEHLGIELTLFESSDQYNTNTDLVKTAYKNADDGTKTQGAYGYFGTIAKQMGYTHDTEKITYNGDKKKRTVWTGPDGTKYVYENGQWIAADDWVSEDGKRKVMDKDIYAKIIGTNKAEDILDEITAITPKSDEADRKTNLSNNLTLEEAQWVAKHSDEWIANRSSNEIIEAAQEEALTSTGTMKSRIQDTVKESKEMTISDFEDLIESGKKVDEIIDEFSGPHADDLEKELNRLKDRADLLGISLAEAYNQAKNLSSIDKFGMTTKTVQSIVTEAETMMNIAMGANQGSISGELLTYLQEHAPELLGYNGSELSAEIMKSLGTSTLIGASLKGTLSNSNAYFDRIYNEIIEAAQNESEITTSTAWSNEQGAYLTSNDFDDHIKNNRDMVEFQDLFKGALVEVKDANGNVTSSYYSPERIQGIANERDDAKEWLDNHGITGEGDDWKGDLYAQAAAYGGTIQKISGTVESEMKKAIADKIVKISEHNVQQAKKAFKDLTKNIRDLNEQLKDLEKQNAINKLNNELERLTMNIDGLDKKISLFDWASGFLAEGDFEGKSKALEDNLTALADKNKDLSAAMAEVESKTPKSAEEAEALKQKYDELSSSYIENQKAILEVQKQMEALGVTMLSSAINESFEALNKQMQITSDYAKLSNLRTYTGGAAGLLNYNLAGTIESKSEVDKKRSQYETLLKMQEDFNKQSLDLNKQYLEMKEKQDAEDYNKQKSDTAESIRDARVEFFQEYGHILQERLGDKDKALAAVGLTEQDLVNYYKSTLSLPSMTYEDASSLVNNIFDNTPKGGDEPKGDNTPKGGDEPKGDEKPETKPPVIEGTDVKVDTPESVSNHITSTMAAGINSANLDMAENPDKYSIKAPPLNDKTWGVTVTDGLGLKFRNAYIEIMKALNKYIENPDTQDAKLTSPPLKWSGKRGWENDLVNRMKTKTNEAIGKVNEYLTNGESAKLQAPKVDEKTWEKFGITIGKYISDGIEYGTQLGFGNSLDVLLDSYDKNKNSGGAGSSSLASYSGGSAPISPNGIPVGATVYMNSPNTNGHVGIVGTDGRIYNMWNRKQSPNGSGVCAMTLQELANSKRTAISWGWNGGKELTREQALAVAKEAQSFKSYGKKPGSCQGWVASVYANAGVQKYTSKTSATNAGKSWGKYNIPSDAYTAIGTSKTGDSSYLFPTNGLFGLEKVQNLFSYANGTKKSNKITKAIELALLSATAIPGVDTFANLGIAGLKLAEGSYGSAALALFSALPIVGELGDGVQYVSKAKKLIKAVSAVNIPIEIASAMSSSYADGSNGHPGGLALVGDEGLVNNKSGLFPELVILPNDEIALMGTQGPVLANLPKGTEVLNNSDTEDILGVNSYADGTDGVVVGNQVNDLEVKGDLNVEGNENVSGDLNTNDQKYKSAIDDTLVENYEKEFTNMLDNIVGERETTDRILRDKYQRNNYKIPVLSEYERLENEATDAISRAEYNLLETIYATSDDALDYKQLANYAKKKNEEAQKQLGIAISEGKPLEVVQAWSKIVEETQAKVKEYEESIQAALDATLEAFSNYATTADNIFNNIKDNLNADFENGWLGEKTSSNYYNPLKEAADERIKNISDAYNGALQEAINKYLELGFNIDVATSKAMEEDVVKELQKSRKNAIRERTQIELDENNDRIANYERANQKIEEKLGYNSNLSNSQFRDVYTDTLANTQDMIAEDIRALKDIENLSPEDQKALIDRLNKNTKAQIDITSTYIDNILNKAKRLTDASINERDKQLSVGGITTYDENGNSIFEKNIEDFKEEGEAIAQAIADTRYNLAEEARYNGLTDAEDIEEYINKHESMISLNEQHLDNLKKQAEEHKKIRNYTLEQLNNEKKLLDLSKENEWASKANIQNYYDAVDESLDAQIAAQKKYLESKNLSEEEYQQTKMAIAELEREKHNNALQRMQDTQAFYEKEYNAMTYMVNEYITALSDEKETISETYDEEIDKLQQVNNAKERSIKLTELQNALENAQNEKKRVYRAGVGFVYEQDREAVKKAKDELDAFYRQDQIDNLTKAKEMESKILDERIEKWNKYLDAMEKVYKTAERNHNIGILENLLGVEGWQGVFNELNSDMSDFVKKYDDGMKIYHGEWTGFLEEYEKLSTKIYDKLESSVELLRNIKEFGTSNTTPDDKNVSVNEFNAEYKDDNIQEYEDENRVKSWKDKRWRNQIRDFSALYSTEEGRAIADKWDISESDAHIMHLTKENELLQFVRKYGYENVFDAINNPANHKTGYSVEEMKDALAYATANMVDLGELTQEEASNIMSNVNRYDEYKKALKKYSVINELLAEDLSEWIQVLEDGSVVQFSGVDFSKEELERIRAEKIWMNYRKGTYGDLGDVNTIEHVKDIIDNTFREEDKGTVGTDQVGMFIDTFIDNISGSINTDKVSDRLQQLLGQIVKEDIVITDEYDIFDNLGATSSILEYESLANNNGSVGSTFNLHNYYIARGENPVGNIIDAAGQMTDITNKK